MHERSWHGNVFRITDPLWKRNHRSPVDTPHKGSVMKSFCVLLAWTIFLTNSPVVSLSRRQNAHVTTLVQAIVWCLKASTHHHNRCWLIVTRFPGNWGTYLNVLSVETPLISISKLHLKNKLAIIYSRYKYQCCNCRWKNANLCWSPGAFYYKKLTLIPTWISNHIPSKVWNEITCTVEVWEWISNFTLYNWCSYLSMWELKLNHVSKRPPADLCRT